MYRPAVWLAWSLVHGCTWLGPYAMVCDICGKYGHLKAMCESDYGSGYGGKGGGEVNVMANWYDAVFIYVYYIYIYIYIFPKQCLHWWGSSRYFLGAGGGWAQSRCSSCPNPSETTQSFWHILHPRLSWCLLGALVDSWVPWLPPWCFLAPSWVPAGRLLGVSLGGFWVPSGCSWVPPGCSWVLLSALWMSPLISAIIP